MTRTAAREIAVHLVYQLGFGGRSAQEVLEDALTREHFAAAAAEEPLYAQFPDEQQLSYIRTLVQGVYEHREELDGYISRYAVGWSRTRIPRVAAAVLQAAMYELLYMPDVPTAAAINEAVEIVKGYDTQEVASFLNGILGSFVREERPRGDEPPQAAEAQAPGESEEG